MPRVLVVDDDPEIRELMRDCLEADGFAVAMAPDADAAQREMARGPVDCVLLDVMMPQRSGFELCRAIRRTSPVPVLFLSARDTDADKLRGLGLGADDYVVKSATPAEVVARIRAVLRRAAPGPVPPPARRYGRLEIDPATREVLVDGVPVALTAKEFDLLELLSARPRVVHTREQILDRVWGYPGGSHSVTVLVSRLREKLEPDPTDPRHIRTVRGIGYRFEP